MEVCAVVHQPDNSITCPIAFPFEVSLSTIDGTAGIIVSFIMIPVARGS